LKHTPQSEQGELQYKIVVAKKTLYQGQAHMDDFSRVVEYNFNLWMHLQNAPKSTPLKIVSVQLRNKSMRRSRCSLLVSGRAIRNHDKNCHPSLGDCIYPF
jgi:hypothetical protein